ncbi:gamma-glutamyl-gamma-aminobutyrate hydrolase family protein [Paenibacillus sp. CC-CFT747]|nr:gamma-glutamyl-gamma-aminobutyrate hydrolase family protein [Paenibacillus sp. CC-CFT747]
MRPVIGLTMYEQEDRYVLRRTYTEAVEQAGGIPLLLPIRRTRETRRSSRSGPTGSS